MNKPVISSVKHWSHKNKFTTSQHICNKTSFRRLGLMSNLAVKVVKVGTDSGKVKGITFLFFSYKYEETHCFYHICRVLEGKTIQDLQKLRLWTKTLEEQFAWVILG